MNTYKYRAFMEIKKDISSLKNCIAQKSESIERKKEEIELLEKEIIEDKKMLNQAIDFKNELESRNIEITDV